MQFTTSYSNACTNDNNFVLHSIVTEKLRKYFKKNQQKNWKYLTRGKLNACCNFAIKYYTNNNLTFVARRARKKKTHTPPMCLWCVCYIESHIGIGDDDDDSSNNDSRSNISVVILFIFNVYCVRTCVGVRARLCMCACVCECFSVKSKTQACTRRQTFIHASTHEHNNSTSDINKLKINISSLCYLNIDELSKNKCMKLTMNSFSQRSNSTSEIVLFSSKLLHYTSGHLIISKWISIQFRFLSRWFRFGVRRNIQSFVSS